MALQINNPKYGNVFVAADTFADLRTVPSSQIVQGYSAIVAGSLSPADGLGGMFVWQATSTTADNGQTVIAPSDGTTGRWTKIAVGQTGPIGVTGQTGLTGATGVQGATGGNVMAIGLLTASTNLPVPTGANAVRTSGHTVAGVGIADYIYDPSLAASYVTANPRSSFAAQDGRVFRLSTPTVDVLTFGARGIGSAFNDTTAIQAAIDFVWNRGGGTVVLPWTNEMSTTGYYNTTTTLIVRPKVSIVGDPRRSKIKNLTNGGTGTGDVFLPGNFHPDFTEDLPMRDCGTMMPGMTVTLTSSASLTLTVNGSPSTLTVGDQILTKSTSETLTGGFKISYFMHLNEIVGISGNVITLRWPIDCSYAGGLARLADVTTGAARPRNIPLFFAQDSVIENIDVETPASWMSDSACRNVVFRNNIVKSQAGCYGNAFQHCRWTGNTFYWSQAAGELSENSLNNSVDNNTFIYIPQAGVTPYEGFGFNEHNRKTVIDGCYFDFGSYAGPGALMTFRQAQYCVVQNSQFKFNSTNGPSLITINTNTGPDFPTTNCRVTNCDFDIQATARFITIDTSSNPLAINNGVDNCRFSGVTTAFDAVRFGNSIGNYVKRCTIGSGGVLLGAGNSGNIVEDNYIDTGFPNSMGDAATEDTLRANRIRRNRYAGSTTRDGIRRDNISAIYIGPSLSVDAYVGDLGTFMQYRDEYSMDFIVQPGGNTNDRTVRFYIQNVTDATPIELFSHLIPAAATGLTRIAGKIMIGAQMFYAFSASGSTTGSYVGQVARVANTKALSLRVQGISGAGNTGITFSKMRVDHDNPYVS